MNVQPLSAPSLSTPSTSPLFDELANSIQPARRPVTPITAATRWINRVKARSVVFTPSAAVADPISVERPLREPLDGSDLTADERAIVAEMGDTVARLILQMLDEDDTKRRRR